MGFELLNDTRELNKKIIKEEEAVSLQGYYKQMQNHPKIICIKPNGKWIWHNFQYIKKTCAPRSKENIDVTLNLAKYMDTKPKYKLIKFTYISYRHIIER